MANNKTITIKSFDELSIMVTLNVMMCVEKNREREVQEAFNDFIEEFQMVAPLSISQPPKNNVKTDSTPIGEVINKKAKKSKLPKPTEGVAVKAQG